jgi:hypothetical protein
MPFFVRTLGQPGSSAGKGSEKASRVPVSRIKIVRIKRMGRAFMVCLLDEGKMVVLSPMITQLLPLII